MRLIATMLLLVGCADEVTSPIADVACGDHWDFDGRCDHACAAMPSHLGAACVTDTLAGHAELADQPSTRLVSIPMRVDQGWKPPQR